ncbi:hypothetical protein BU15DRAFT_65387 [Melanogaster broomeanus]|nr:hypothetical protein BU15DRAFT_65387 [Melanogaster broomeanus]
MFSLIRSDRLPSQQEQEEQRLRAQNEELTKLDGDNQRTQIILPQSRRGIQRTPAVASAREGGQGIDTTARKKRLCQTLSLKQRLTTETSNLRRELDRKDIQLKNLRTELQRSRTRDHELTTILEACTRRLDGTKAAKTDCLSGAELQTCTSAGACRRDEGGEHEDQRADGSYDDTSARSRWQGAMVEFSRRIIMTCDRDDLQAEKPLAEIYGDIRDTGEIQPQPNFESYTDIAAYRNRGSWWSTACIDTCHAQKMAMQETDLHATMVSHISNTLVNIIVAAGCTKNYEDAYRDFTQEFGKEVSNIVRMASRLKKAMGEEMTSADLWPLHAATGEKLDGATMENFDEQYGYYRNLDGETVLCTIALGLQRFEKVARGDTFEYKNTTLLKAKVALECLGDELEREEA